MKFLPTPSYVLYLARFGVFFSLFYFGTLLTIGLSTPENAFSPFVYNYLNFPSALRSVILGGTQFFLALLSYQSHFSDQYTLALESGAAVKLVYSCLGYGVMSFWAAFVLANKGTLGRRLAWLLTGWLAVYFLNVIRIGLLLLAVNNNKPMPFGLDHHFLFNAAAYLAVFLLIYLYDRSVRLETQPLQRNGNRSVEIQK